MVKITNIVENAWLKTMTFSSAKDLYAFLVGEVKDGLLSLDLDSEISDDFHDFQVLLENFGIETRDLAAKRDEILMQLDQSVESYPAILMHGMHHRWVTTITSIFFLVEPEIIKRNTQVVKELWEVLQRRIVLATY